MQVFFLLSPVKQIEKWKFENKMEFVFVLLVPNNNKIVTEYTRCIFFIKKNFQSFKFYLYNRV